MEDPKMARRSFIILDATLESQAPFFAGSPIFKTWLRSYNNVPDVLELISKITLPYSIQVYVARDNILDDGLPADTNGPMRNLIETFCACKTIRHVSIFFPEINDDLAQQTRSIIPDPRMIKDVISAVDLHRYMCKEGIEYLTEEITRYMSTNEVHLIPNLQRNIEELMEYWNKIHNDRKQILDRMQDEHSNKPGEEAS